MRVLLDTHTLLRMLMGDDRLSPHARSLLLEPTNERWVLPISLVEIALKIRRIAHDFTDPSSGSL